MGPKTLRAHFDGERICLDDPYPLQTDTKLLIIVLPDLGEDEDHQDWLRLSQAALESAYGGNEPDYSLKMIKEPNPDYEGR